MIKELLWVFIGILMILLGIVIIHKSAKEQIHNTNQKVIEAVKVYQIEAVERGFAEWDVSTDGNIQFKWKE